MIEQSPQHGLDAFEVLDRLGEGGMGAAWRARHRASGQLVAIKTIKGPAEASRRRLFLSEARAMAALGHHGIVRILEFGEVTNDAHRFDRGTLFIVMELAEGGSIRPAQFSSWRQLRTFLLQVLDALAHAHSRDLVHLDLKPENILRAGECVGEPRYLLADFGISRHVGEREPGRGISGTPAYMAPEQALGQARVLGPWTDLYALGCLCWHIACGQLPFRHDNVVALINAHVHAPRPELAPRWPVPPGLAAWVARLMAVAPAERFATAADAAYALAGLGPAPIKRAPTGPAPDATRSSAEDTHAAAHLAPTQTELAATPTEILPTLAAVTIAHGIAAHTPPPASTGLAADKPPFPDDWRQTARVAERRLRFDDAGAGLFDLRQPPFVGREAERDWLWERFGQVLREGRPDHVGVTGESGVGKSRLVDTLCRRLRELGQAQLLRLELSDRTFGDAVAKSLRAYLRVEGADTGEFDELVALLIPGADPASVGRLAGLRQPPFGERLAFFAALGGMLGHMARQRPVVVVLDDVAFDTLSFDFAKYFVRQHPNACVFFVTTIDEAEASPTVAARVQAMGERCIRLDRLPAQEVATFVDRSLALADAERTRLLEGTDFEPAFAQQVIARWLETNALCVRADGYHGGDLPESQNALWFDRLDDLLEPSVADPAAATLALSTAAVLGATVDRSLWERTCSVLDEPALDESALDEGRSEALLERLSRKGFVEYDADTLRFAQASFRRALLERLDTSAHAEQVYVAAAQILLDEPGRVAAIRAADCLAKAGKIDEALTELRLAAFHHSAVDAAAFSQWALRLVEAHRGGRQQDADYSRQWYLNQAHRALEALQNGDFDTAQVCIEQMEQMPDDRLDPMMVSHYDTVLAYRALFANEPESGLEPARRALAASRRHGDSEQVCADLALLGDLLMYARQFDAADERLREARTLADEVDEYQRAWADFRLGMLALHTGQWEAAERDLNAAMRRFEAGDDPFGTMFARENLGQLAHFRGEFDLAERYLSEALAEAEIDGYRGAVTMHERLGRLHAQLGEPDQALTHLAEVRREAEQNGFHMIVWYFFDAEAEAHARLGDWEACHRLLDEARHSPARPGLHAGAIAATWQRTGHLAGEAGHSALAHACQQQAHAVLARPLQGGE